MVQPPVKYLQLHFATAVELNKILSNLFDNDFYVVKIEPGILSGVLTISFGEEDVYASVTANRALFLCSENKQAPRIHSFVDVVFSVASQTYLLSFLLDAQGPPVDYCFD